MKPLPKHLLISFAIIWISIIVGVISVKYLGEDNIVERGINEVAEDELHLPDGTLDNLIDALSK